MEKQKNFITGKWCEPSTKRYFKKINPAKFNEVLGQYPLSGKKDVDSAVKSAGEVLSEWSSIPGPERGQILFRMAELFGQNKDKLAKIIVQENGKSYASALSEVNGAVAMARYYAGEGRRLLGETVPSGMRRKIALSVRCPVGVVGAITSWNNPLAAFSWKVLPALICGNTIVFKPAEDTPVVAIECLRIAEQAGLLAGVLNLVQGTGEVTGKAIVRHPGVNMISFTGSTEVGREIAAVCGENLKKVCLECGGKNNQVVMDDAILEKAVDAAVLGSFSNAGQKCANTGRILLHKKIAAKFKKLFIAKTRALRLGDGFDPDSQIGPVINEKQLRRIDSFVKEAVRKGSRILVGGKREIKGICNQGYYYQPTIIEGALLSSAIAQEEVFGPVTLLFTFSKLEEALTMANDSYYGLTNSIFTQDISRGFEYLTKIESGVAYINGPTSGAEIQLPFGGVKNSGNGFREAGRPSLDAYSEWKTIYVNY